MPGSPVTEYCNATQTGKSRCKTELPVIVNKVDSTKKFVPYSYTRFAFCSLPPKSGVSQNLGQILGGDRMYKSQYNMTFMKNNNYTRVCQNTYTSNSVKWKHLKEAINLNYQHHWYVDSLPVLWCFDSHKGPYCSPSFPLGCRVTSDGRPRESCGINTDYNQPDTYYIYNHLEFIVMYNPLKKSDEEEEAKSTVMHGKIVKVKVIPHSVQSLPTKTFDSINSITLFPPMAIPANFTDEVHINFTYSVKFQEETTMTSFNRWDFTKNSDSVNRINRFSIMNAVLIIAFLTGGIAILSFRIKASRNKKDESTGWQVIREDVFRPPMGHLPLAVIVGSGVQVMFSVITVLGFASLGTISPANPGSIVTTVLVSYVTLGSFLAGYVSIMLYKMCGGEYWKSTTALTAILLPAMIFFELLMSNIVLLSQQSSAVLPVTTWIAILAIIIFVNTPIVFLGGYIAHKQKKIRHPVPPSDIRRMIPKKTWRQRLGNACWKVLSGFLPVVCILLQLYYVLNGLWFDSFYHSYGFLAIGVFLLMITCVEASVLTCYFELNSENYNWWWKSFIFSGSGCVVLIAYSVHYYCTRIEAHDPVSAYIYYSFMCVVSMAFFVFSGSLGFLSALYFTRQLYKPYKSEYYQKPLSVLVERELRDTSATQERLQAIEEDEEEINTETSKLLPEGDRD
ncbi:transmembrane 9 superfamily member 2-like [Glandiceps talaboti]